MPPMATMLRENPKGEDLAVYVTLNFDVEDTVYPPEADTDGIGAWLARGLGQAGLRGTFHVIGDKARAILERGRTDVSSALAEHDIGIHTDSNLHPLIPELVQDCGWEDGVERVVEYEERAAAALRDAFWKDPVATSRHAVFSAPQSYGAAARMGIPYVYSTVFFPEHPGPVWFAGALCFPSHARGASPYLGLGVEDALCRDDLFEEKLDWFARELDQRLEAGVSCLTVFVGHPIRVKAKGWTEDLLFANGRNRTLDEVGLAYELRTNRELATARESFARLCDYLRRRDDIEVVGVARAAEIFSVQPDAVPRDAILAYCTSGDDPEEPHLDPCFSPAELLVAMCEALVEGTGRGALPRSVPRRDVLGPVEKPVLMPERLAVSREEFLGFCSRLVEVARETGHLPPNLDLDGARVGLGSIHAAAVAAFRAACYGHTFAQMRLRRARRYPPIAHELAQAMTWIEVSSFFGPEFSAEKLRLHMRLQSWTLKPARERALLGPYRAAAALVPRQLALQQRS